MWVPQGVGLLWARQEEGLVTHQALQLLQVSLNLHPFHLTPHSYNLVAVEVVIRSSTGEDFKDM